MPLQNNDDFEQARFNMVEQQIRPWNVVERDILDLMNSTPREQFVPQNYKSLAYADIRIPLEHSQTMLSPKEVARMLQALGINKSETLLEVGTGSGYVTSLLANLAKKVYSIDIVGDFIEQAQQKTAKLGLKNIEFEEADAATGWPHYGPYDVIVISAGFYQLPESFIKSLKVGGRLFCIEGEKPVMQATLITKTSTDSWRQEILFETEVDLMINSQKREQFIF